MTYIEQCIGHFSANGFSCLLYIALVCGDRQGMDGEGIRLRAIDVWIVGRL